MMKNRWEQVYYHKPYTYYIQNIVQNMNNSAKLDEKIHLLLIVPRTEYEYL